VKKNYSIEVKLTDELYRKLVYISASEGRNINNQFIFLLRNNIAYFERTKGKIDPAELMKIELPEGSGDED